MKIGTFSIVIGTPACNARCPFCVSKMTGDMSLSIKPVPFHWQRFHKACQLAKVNNVTTVMLTSKGEPTLFPTQISEVLAQLEAYDFPLIELQTNAILFAKKSDEYREHLKKWIARGLVTVAISVVHWEKHYNQPIYTPYSEYPDLESTVNLLHELGASVRLTVVMVKDILDTPEKVAQLCQVAKTWNVEQVTVRPVNAVSDDEGNHSLDVQAWSKEHMVDAHNLQLIRLYLDQYGHKLMTLPHGGTVYDLYGQNICITGSLTLESDSDDLRQIIFFPDGRLFYDWRFEGARIF